MQPVTVSTLARVIPTTTTKPSVESAIVSALRRPLWRHPPYESSPLNPLLHHTRCHLSASACNPLAMSSAPFHSKPAHVASSVLLFSSADSSAAAFNPFSNNRAPSLHSLPDVAPSTTSGPFTASIENRDKVISVATDYARYYWRRSDIFVDLPLLVAVAARRPQTNSCSHLRSSNLVQSRMVLYLRRRRRPYFRFK